MIRKESLPGRPIKKIGSKPEYGQPEEPRYSDREAGRRAKGLMQEALQTYYVHVPEFRQRIEEILSSRKPDDRSPISFDSFLHFQRGNEQHIVDFKSDDTYDSLEDTVYTPDGKIKAFIDLGVWKDRRTRRIWKGNIWQGASHNTQTAEKEIRDYLASTYGDVQSPTEVEPYK